MIHHPGGEGVRFLDAVVAAGGLDVAAAHQAAVLLLEYLDGLVAVHLVLMEAHAGDQIVAHRAPFKAVGQLGLYAFGGVLAVVVLETHVGHVLVAVENRLGVGVAVVGVLDQVTDALAASAGHLEPVALELVAVEGGFQAGVAAQYQVMPQGHAVMVVVHLVKGAEPVAAVGVVTEIAVAEAQVAVVGDLAGVRQLELHGLLHIGGVGAGPAQLGHVVLLVEAGVPVGAVHVLEAVAALLVSLQQEAPLPLAGAVPDVAALMAVLAGLQLHHAGLIGGNRRGQHVQRAAHGEGPVTQGVRAFQHLHAVEAAGAGEVIGRRRRVGRGGDGNAVFHHGDAVASVGAGAANTDIGPQAVALFLLHIDAGHIAQNAVHVGVFLFLQVLVGQHMGRAGQAEGVLVGADDVHGGQPVAVGGQGFGEQQGGGTAKGAERQGGIASFHRYGSCDVYVL